MEPFGDLTDASREFIIAIIEELQGDEYSDKGTFKAFWNSIQERWSLTASGRPVELSVTLRTATLEELARERLDYILKTTRGYVSECTILRKAFDQYRLYSEPPPTTDIFLNYREQDTLYHLGPLDYRLKIGFGADRVFFAKRGIDVGDEWRDVIEDAIGKSTVMLVLIGPRWVGVTDEKGEPKLDDPNDIVRWEIETALDQGMRLVPVLLEGASMPRKEDLPGSLKALPDLQAHRVNGYDWERDTDTLIKVIEDHLVQSGAGP